MFTPSEHAALVRKLQELKNAQRALSHAYLRLRGLIPGAFDTPTAPSAEEVWTVTEQALKNLLARAEIRETAKNKVLEEED